MQRRPAEKGIRPFELRSQKGHAVSLVVYLALPNFSPRASLGPFGGGNVAMQLVLTGPGLRDIDVAGRMSGQVGETTELK